MEVRVGTGVRDHAPDSHCLNRMGALGASLVSVSKKLRTLKTLDAWSGVRTGSLSVVSPGMSGA
jgi:hypothetical protein